MEGALSLPGAPQPGFTEVKLDVLAFMNQGSNAGSPVARGTGDESRVELFNAAAEGSCAAIDALLSRTSSVDLNEGIDQHNKWTPLHAAAAGGHTAACRCLVGWGASVHAVTAAGETPLHLCAARGHVAAFAFLLAHSAPGACSCCIPTHSSEGVSCLACDWAREVSEAASPALRSTSSFGLLVKRLAGVQQAENAPDNQGRTPLHVAAQAGHDRIVAALLAAGSDVTAASSAGETPLHLAAAGGHAPTVDRLLLHELKNGGDGSCSVRVGESGDSVTDSDSVGHSVPGATRRGGWAGWWPGGDDHIHTHLGGPLPKGFRVRYSMAVGVVVAVVVVAVLVTFLAVQFGEKVPEAAAAEAAAGKSAPGSIRPSEHVKEASPWSYDDQGADWGDLRNASTGALLFADCNGHQQSPIDLAPAEALRTEFEPLSRIVTATHFRIVTRPSGHPGFQLVPQDGDVWWLLDGELFRLQQAHFHSPSEHRIDGFQYPLEAHFVHQNPITGAFAVFGLLYNYTDQGPNPFLEAFWEEIYRQVGGLRVDLASMLDDVGGGDYFRYTGSFTTPPCTEPVKWVVAESALGTDPFQVYIYNFVVSEPNWRIPQPLNGRQVEQDTQTLGEERRLHRGSQKTGRGHRGHAAGGM